MPAPFRDFVATPTAMPTPPVTPRGMYLPMRLANAPVIAPASGVATGIPVASGQPQSWLSPMRIVNDIGYSLPYPPTNASGQPAYTYDQPNVAALRNAMNVGPQQQAQGGGGGGGASWSDNGGGYPVPYGVDPRWYAAFVDEHKGKTPEQVYRRDGDYAVAHALSDKAWGEQFYRTYNRPPTDDDWHASYYQRQAAFYNG